MISLFSVLLIFLIKFNIVPFIHGIGLCPLSIFDGILSETTARKISFHCCQSMLIKCLFHGRQLLLKKD